MKKRLLFSLICATAGFGNAQTTITLQPDASQGKDAVLHGESSFINSNFGTSDQFPGGAWTFSGSPGVLRSVVDFDLSSVPSGAVVNSAYLSLYAIDYTGGFGQHSSLSGSNECWIQRVTSSWDENTVTWNNQPASTTTNQVALAQSTSPTQNYIDIDVSAIAQDMVNDPANSHGFMLKLQDENYYRLMNFASSDHSNGALRPKLVLTYTPMQSDTCATLQPGANEGKDVLLHGEPASAGTNFGTNTQFPATAWTFSGSEGVVRSAVEFDLSFIPGGSTINSASLSLYAWDNTGGMGQHSPLSGSNACWVQRITTSWDEMTATWNAQPSTTTTNQVALAQSTSPTQDYTNIDVAALVQDMIDNPSSSYGFMLSLQDETYYRRMNFCSSDHSNSALHPKLEVCYTLNNASLDEIESTEAFSIYPNPATKIAMIVATGQMDELLVYNAQGQIVFSENDMTTNQSIDVSMFESGLYYVQVSVDGKLSTQKMIVQ